MGKRRCGSAGGAAASSARHEAGIGQASEPGRVAVYRWNLACSISFVLPIMYHCKLDWLVHGSSDELRST